MNEHEALREAILRKAEQLYAEAIRLWTASAHPDITTYLTFGRSLISIAPVNQRYHLEIAYLNAYCAARDDAATGTTESKREFLEVTRRTYDTLAAMSVN